MAKFIFIASVVGNLATSHSCQWQAPGNWKLVVATVVWSTDLRQLGQAHHSNWVGRVVNCGPALHSGALTTPIFV